MEDGFVASMFALNADGAHPRSSEHVILLSKQICVSLSDLGSTNVTSYRSKLSDKPPFAWKHSSPRKSQCDQQPAQRAQDASPTGDKGADEGIR